MILPEDTTFKELMILNLMKIVLNINDRHLLADSLRISLDNKGIEGMLNKFDYLRDRYYGSHTYDFSQKILNSFAYDLIANKDYKIARAVLEKNLEHFPKSDWVYFYLADVEQKTGHRDKALKHLAQSLKFNPKNFNSNRLLKRMKAGGNN